MSLLSRSIRLCFLAAVAVSACAQNGIPRPDHIVIVVEENHSFSDVIGSASAPYINSLAQQGALFTSSFAIRHPSQPNYVALFSGSTQALTDDSCPHTFSGPNLASELISGGYTFAGFSESMPAAGFMGCGSGGYARKHNPWVNFPSVPGTANQPLTSWPSDFNLLPTVAFVIPNLGDDMHDGSVQRGDTWLREHMDGYVQWARAHNSLLILTWDEDDRSEGNRIPTVFVGPMVQRAIYSGRIDHYTVLRTLEDMFGLPYAGESGSATPILNVWTTPNTSLSVRLESSANETVFRPGTNITFVATASDPTATVEKVEFFSGNMKVAESFGPDFTFTWNDVQPGVYSVNVKAFNARGEVASSSPVEITVMSPAAAFARAKGGYRGLFSDANGIALESSGAFALNTTERATFTAQLQLAGKRYSWSGQFDAEGRATNTIPRASLSPLAVELRLGLLDTLDEVLGRVTDGTWSADLAADRAVFNRKTNPAPFAGKYTLILPGADDYAAAPGGDGFGTVTVDAAGNIRLKATLADGTKASQKSVLSKYGQWPLYLPLYGGAGAVATWVTFTNRARDDFDGALTWIKHAQPSAKLYPTGFTNQTQLIGSAYVSPAATSGRILSFTNGLAAFTGGSLVKDFTNSILLNASGQIVNLSSNRLRLKFTLSTGLFSGSVTDPTSGSAFSFNGAVLQKQNAGSGFLPGTTRNGRVSILPAD